VSSINRVVLTGRIATDLELRTTPTGKQVVSFRIAVQRRFKPQTPDQPDADFLTVVAWNQQAEFLHSYAEKGRMVGVDGRLQSRRYTAGDGTERYVVEVVADSVVLLDRPRDAQAPESAVVSAPMASEPEPDDYDPFAEE
jgi:single-strand DNA-binding protein